MPWRIVVPGATRRSASSMLQVPADVGDQLGHATPPGQRLRQRIRDLAASRRTHTPPKPAVPAGATSRGRPACAPRASARRCGRPAAGRRSGRSRRSRRGRPRALLRGARRRSPRATARSAAGSSIRTPPATFTKTSLEPSATPAWRPSTARIIDSRLRSKPVAARRGIARSLSATSACTSTRIGRVPSIAGSSTEPGPGLALDGESRRRVGHRAEAGVGHLEDADLVGRPEAVLDRAQDAQEAVAVALELQHGVDQVLEHPRPGDRAVLGDVADQHDGDVVAFGQPQQAVGRFAHLGDAARRRRQVGGVQRLHRVDDARRRARSARSRRRPRRARSRPARGSDRRRPAARARRRTWAGDSSPLTSSARLPAAPMAPSACSSSELLPTPGSPADQHQRAGHQPAAEHPVELAEPGRDAGRRGRPERRDSGRTAALTARRPAARRRARPPRPACSTRRTPCTGPSTSGSGGRRTSRCRRSASSPR